MLRQASDAQLRKLYMKGAKEEAPPPAEESPTEEELALLEQSLAPPKG